MNFPNAERQLTEFPFEEKAKTDVASPLLLQAHDLWDRKRANRLMPARADLDPVEMPKLLPHMALIEVRPYGQRLRVRLVGTNIVNIYGANFTGQYMDEIDFGDAGDKILSDYQFATGMKRPLFSDHAFRKLNGIDLNIERVILPLSDDNKTVSMLFVVMSFRKHA
jgi:hypothetical protein